MQDNKIQKSFQEIEVGDIVNAYDEYAHDILIHTIRVDYIEYDEEYITETNPTGKICYGEDLDMDYWGDDYLTNVNEANFWGYEYSDEYAEYIKAS